MATNNLVHEREKKDLNIIKANQRAIWEDGDYASFAKYMESGAIEILENWQISRETKLLDIACGSGQTAIPAAKRGIQVTGIDIASNLIQHARKRALKARLNVQFDEGDAENLPYKDNSFDVCISMFGAMFAPRPDLVVNEIARVLKPGGQLFMANWTPSSMPAQMFKAISDFIPAPPGIVSPVLWGDNSMVAQRLSANFTHIKLCKKFYPQWLYPFDAEKLVELFRTFFGPVKRAFDVSDIHRQKRLRETLKFIYKNNSELCNGILTITGGEYLEVIATRK